MLRGAIERHNAYADDPVLLRGGWAVDRDDLYAQAGVGPTAIDFVQTYDDYPVVVMLQFEDLGFCDKGEGPDFVRAARSRTTATSRTTPAAASSRPARPAPPAAFSA